MLTVQGAIGTRGAVATMTIEKASGGDIFLAHLSPCLPPQLCAGNVSASIKR